MSFIVLNWRSEDATLACVSSILQLDDLGAYEIIVVDNESDRSSRAALTDDRWRLVCLPTNQGFAGGMNAGAAVATGEYLAILNNDLVLRADWLREALRPFDAPEVGIVGGRDDDTSVPTLSPNGAFWLSHADQPLGPVPAVDGGQLLISRATWERLKGFDVDYFAYHEDLDLCARAWATGWQVIYNPQLYASHRRGTSSQRVRWRRGFWARRNRLTWLATHFPEGAWRPAVRSAMLEYAREVMYGLPRSSAWGRDSWEARLGSLAALLWLPVRWRWLTEKRRTVIASGEHDEGYRQRLVDSARGTGPVTGATRTQ